MTRLSSAPIAAAIAATLPLAACAPMEEDAPATTAAANLTPALAEGEQCFFPRSVSGYRDAPDGPNGEDRLYIDVGANDTYLFETFGVCPQLDFAFRIGLDPDTIGQICSDSPSMPDLLIPDPALGVQRCPIRMVGKVAGGDDATR